MPSVVSQPLRPRACYENSLVVAVALGAKSVAFPLISSGIYRWPKQDAAAQALTALQTAPPTVELVRLVLFDDDTRLAAERARHTP
jgi:O-acetyl-ADP-ribose deacetylase (regulator of RNase III)